jgi:MFS family permease
MLNDTAQKRRNLLVLTLVMLINALSYGTIIPLLYPYAARFGINAQMLGLLFASFSAAQLIATPVIGRLSDKYGRKPLLLLSLFGTSVSLLLFGLARSAIWLFVARVLDGITGGNVSVAQAAIADSTDTKDRAQAFGVLGAAFGVGFVLGPALGGVLSTISISAPFFAASGLALVGVLVGVGIFAETNVTREVKPRTGHLIDVRELVGAFFSPTVGSVFTVSLLSLIAMNSMIIGFQSYTVDVLALSSFQIGVIFSLFGVMTIIMQGFGIRYLMAKVTSKRRLVRGSLLLGGILLASVALSQGVVMFVGLLLAYGAVNSPISPVLTSLLSERTNVEDQGGVLGLNQAYTSLAQIIGPLAAGLVVGVRPELVFVMAGMLMLITLLPAARIANVGERVDL